MISCLNNSLKILQGILQKKGFRNNCDLEGKFSLLFGKSIFRAFIYLVIVSFLPCFLQNERNKAKRSLENTFYFFTDNGGS